MHALRQVLINEKWPLLDLTIVVFYYFLYRYYYILIQI